MLLHCLRGLATRYWPDNALASRSCTTSWQGMQHSQPQKNHHCISTDRQRSSLRWQACLCRQHMLCHQCWYKSMSDRFQPHRYRKRCTWPHLIDLPLKKRSMQDMAWQQKRQQDRCEGQQTEKDKTGSLDTLTWSLGSCNRIRLGSQTRMTTLYRKTNRWNKGAQK